MKLNKVKVTLIKWKYKFKKILLYIIIIINNISKGKFHIKETEYSIEFLYIIYNKLVSL